MTLNPKIQADLDQLAADLAAGTHAVVPIQWWRSPGAPYTEGESAVDNLPRAKELAAQNRRVNGDHGSIADSDFAGVLELADFIGAATTAQEAESKVVGAAFTDTDAVIYEVILGQMNGYPAGLGGAPRLMYVGVRLGDLIHAPGTPVGGNVAR